jgi:hypothetical protein
MKKGPFKMKGWSPFTKKTGKGPIMPKDHTVTPPTEEQSKKSKGKLFERDLTGFKRDDRVGTKEQQYKKRIKGMSGGTKRTHDFIYKIFGKKKY